MGFNSAFKGLNVKLRGPKFNVYLILLSLHSGNISTNVGFIIFSPEHMFSNKEILLCNDKQSEFKANTMNSIDHNIAGISIAQEC